MASALANLLTGGFLGGVSQVINSIRGKSPEDAAKLEEIRSRYETEFMTAQAELAKAQIAENVALNETAGQNIRAEQGDKYSGRARPTVVYAWIAVILYNYIVTGLIGRPPIVMPDMFWEVSGIVITGYVFARTGDKLFGGAGGSFSLPFGIKADSKGDSK